LRSALPWHCRWRHHRELRRVIDGFHRGRFAALSGQNLYLVNIVFGAFALGVVPSILVTPDMAATAHNIQAHEMLYRLGLAAHVVVTVTNIPLALIFYELFKVVDRSRPSGCLDWAAHHHC
jgi:hypothetical protein